MAKETKHIFSFVLSYSPGHPIDLGYKTHGGNSLFVKLSAARSARLHEFAIAIAEEQFAENLRSELAHPASALLPDHSADNAKAKPADFTQPERSAGVNLAGNEIVHSNFDDENPF